MELLSASVREAQPGAVGGLDLELFGLSEQEGLELGGVRPVSGRWCWV